MGHGQGCLKSDSETEHRAGAKTCANAARRLQAGSAFSLGGDQLCFTSAQRAGFSSNDFRRWLDHRLTVVKYLILAPAAQMRKATNEGEEQIWLQPRAAVTSCCGCKPRAEATLGKVRVGSHCSLPALSWCTHLPAKREGDSMHSCT